MIQSRPFGDNDGYDYFTGAQRLFHYDHAVDRFHIETIEDLTELVDQNKANFNDRDGRFKGEMVPIARIPMTIFMDLQAKGITRDPKAFKKWLNDPDNRFFRTKAGYV